MQQARMPLLQSESHAINVGVDTIACMHDTVCLPLSVSIKLTGPLDCVGVVSVETFSAVLSLGAIGLLPIPTATSVAD